MKNRSEKTDIMPLLLAISAAAAIIITRTIFALTLRRLYDSGLPGQMLYLFLLTAACGFIPIMIYVLFSKPVMPLLYDKHEYRTKPLPSAAITAAGAVLCIGINILLTKLSILLPSHSGTVTPDTAGGIDGNIISVIVFAAAPAAAEELLFRSFMLGTLRKYGSIWAILISSAVFAAMHSGFAGIIYAFFAGIILSAARIKTGRLSVAVCIHFLADLAGIFITI